MGCLKLQLAFAHFPPYLHGTFEAYEAVDVTVTEFSDDCTPTSGDGATGATAVALEFQIS